VFAERLRIDDRERSDRDDQLRSIDERQAFFGFERDR
jgi:hypothetical protein